jgi:hypothetical protein
MPVAVQQPEPHPVPVLPQRGSTVVLSRSQAVPLAFPPGQSVRAVPHARADVCFAAAALLSGERRVQAHGAAVLGRDECGERGPLLQSLVRPQHGDGHVCVKCGVVGRADVCTHVDAHPFIAFATFLPPPPLLCPSAEVLWRARTTCGSQGLSLWRIATLNPGRSSPGTTSTEQRSGGTGRPLLQALTGVAFVLCHSYALHEDPARALACCCGSPHCRGRLL